MLKPKARRMERLPPKCLDLTGKLGAATADRGATAAAIDRIADQTMTEMGEMGTYLMGAPRL